VEIDRERIQEVAVVGIEDALKIRIDGWQSLPALPAQSSDSK